MMASLYEFLDLQASGKGNTEEQAKFKDDAVNYLGLLVFTVMLPKMLFMHLLQSIQVYPNDPGSDPDWEGKPLDSWVIARPIPLHWDYSEMFACSVHSLGCCLATGVIIFKISLTYGPC